MSALLSVGATPLKNPSKYDIKKADLDSENSYTSETGILVRDMIRANHVTIDIAWEHLTQAELQAITNLISPDDADHFNLTFYDYYTGNERTEKFYSADRSASGIRVKRTNESGWESYSLSTSLIMF